MAPAKENGRQQCTKAENDSSILEALLCKRIQSGLENAGWNDSLHQKLPAKGGKTSTTSKWGDLYLCYSRFLFTWTFTQRNILSYSSLLCSLKWCSPFCHLSIYALILPYAWNSHFYNGIKDAAALIFFFNICWDAAQSIPSRSPWELENTRPEGMIRPHDGVHKITIASLIADRGHVEHFRKAASPWHYSKD